MIEIILALTATIVTQAETQERDSNSPAWAIIARRHAAACKVYPTEAPDRPYSLLQDPVSHRAQDVQGSSKGSVFVWREPSGRPAAICDVFLFENGPQQFRLNNEWHSLSDAPLRAEWSGQMLFAAELPGLKWQPIPEAPVPADKPQQRDRQARRLAERFSAHLFQRKRDRFELRLLPTPLYRFDTTGSESSLGGALFAFCQQTDPELLLLVEARRSGSGYRWEHAPAGFSDMDLYLHRDGVEVWRDAPAFSSGVGVHSGGRVRVVDIATELEAARRSEDP